MPSSINTKKNQTWYTITNQLQTKVYQKILIYLPYLWESLDKMRGRAEFSYLLTHLVTAYNRQEVSHSEHLNWELDLDIAHGWQGPNQLARVSCSYGEH